MLSPAISVHILDFISKFLPLSLRGDHVLIIANAECGLKLDIGCGKRKKPGFVGIDIDKNSDADIVCSALDLPFEDSTVGEIHCSHFVEHLHPEEAQKFFDEMHRILKSDGTARLKIDRDWSEKRLLTKDPEHKKRYSTEEIKAMVRKFKSARVENKIYRFGWHIRQKIFVELKK